MHQDGYFRFQLTDKLSGPFRRNGEEPSGREEHQVQIAQIGELGLGQLVLAVIAEVGDLEAD